MTVITRPDTRATATAIRGWAGVEAAAEAAANHSARLSSESIAKRVVDLVGALIGLVLLSPLLVVVAIVIRLSSPGAALYRQERVGLDGRVFSIVKFRTMHVDAEERLAALKAQGSFAGPLFKLENDPRITRVGRVLRKFSIDELPQLWNVLMGDMSLVGPRPALQCEVDEYCPRALRRLEAVPGMTGAWQVSGRSDLTWEQSLDLDIGYIDGWSNGVDARILLATVRAVVRPVGAY